jgi:hypothetical protein
MTRKYFHLIALLAIWTISLSVGAAMAEHHETPETSGSDTVQFLFIHHSCGGQLLAPVGPSEGAACIYVSHPNGGGLREDLEGIGYQVNEASYGSIVGDKTDICHWSAKFSEHMGRILNTKNQDDLLPDGITNNIVAFKSCFPNNAFVGQGDEPGTPDSCELTVANAKAAYRSILPEFAKHPDVLYVAFTAPALAKGGGLKGFVKKLLGRIPKNQDLAREFNNWLADRENGWLAGYDLPNVVVFDYYDVLTGYGKSDYLAYPTGGGSDSHPSTEGNKEAAKAFVPFIQKAWQNMQKVQS